MDIRNLLIWIEFTDYDIPSNKRESLTGNIILLT